MAKRGIDQVYNDSYYSPLQLKGHITERVYPQDLAQVYGES